MNDSASSAAELFSRDARRREDVLAAFEDAWFRGESPEIADYLTKDGPERRVLLVELVHADLEFRLKAREPVRVETYRQRFPELRADGEAILDLAVAEFELRRRDEPSLSAAEYEQRFPELAGELRRRLATVAHAGGANHPRAGTPGRAMTITVRVIDGPHRGLQFNCDRHDTLLVGRAKEAGLRLNRDRHFSRFHFRLEIAPPACYLTDLDSRNGTFVNGERINRAFLKHGDVISGGRTKIAVTFSSAESTSNDATPTRRMTIVWPGLRPSDRAPVAVGAEESEQPSHGPGEVPAPHVPGYELLEEIGSGAMGRVYRAVHLATGTTAAVKLIIPAHAGDHDATRLFIREAGLLSQLNHPGIVRLLEVGLAEGLPFLAMEYVDAVPHAEILENVPTAERTRIACGIICRVLDALGHAHMQSLVHRDVKPSNILLSRAGRKLQVKLADFGLARNYMVVGLSSITRDGDLRGTIAFMPPEQILDCRYAKPTCDLYAAGVTLYHYLSGKLPYEFAAGRSHFAAVLNEEPTPLDRHVPPLPPDLVAVVHRAIARDRGERFLTAHEMREALLPFTRRAPK